MGTGLENVHFYDPVLDSYLTDELQEYTQWALRHLGVEDTANGIGTANDPIAIDDLEETSQLDALALEVTDFGAESVNVSSSNLPGLSPESTNAASITPQASVSPLKRSRKRKLRASTPEGWNEGWNPGNGRALFTKLKKGESLPQVRDSVAFQTRDIGTVHSCRYYDWMKDAAARPSSNKQAEVGHAPKSKASRKKGVRSHAGVSQAVQEEEQQTVAEPVDPEEAARREREREVEEEQWRAAREEANRRKNEVRNQRQRERRAEEKRRRAAEENAEEERREAEQERRKAREEEDSMRNALQAAFDEEEEEEEEISLRNALQAAFDESDESEEE